jgi:tRNA(Phe) wybutosine-synthesizing methylase Tyw3
MDLSILNGWLVLLASGCAAVIWWLFRSLHSRVERSESDLSDFKLECARTYVTSNALEKAINSLNDTIKEVFRKLERIDEKLDGKADK